MSKKVLVATQQEDKVTLNGVNVEDQECSKEAEVLVNLRWYNGRWYVTVNCCSNDNVDVDVIGR